MHYEFKCPECEGFGTICCGECENEHECKECEGEGLDIKRVDLPAFRAACAERFKDAKSGTWELIENKVWVGRTCGTGAKVYYRDFLKAS